MGTSRMMSWLVVGVLVWIGCPVQAADGPEELPVPEKYASYQEVSTKELKLTPEEFERDRIHVKGAFAGFTVSLPRYVEDSGFRTGRDVALAIAGTALPILVRKDDDMNTLMLALKRGTTIRAFGRLREFRQEPQKGSGPKFYLDCTEVQVLATPDAKSHAGSIARARALAKGTRNKRVLR
ncbi:MAG: hypothetical protein HN849_02825 [Victivallales bacterium]|jgi:hypothetical protein|nr:hypothetical protein [Victivallales bacterium]MBT7298415.1 hypothetical protein [Victivallales bacterium]